MINKRVFDAYEQNAMRLWLRPVPDAETSSQNHLIEAIQEGVCPEKHEQIVKLRQPLVIG